MSRNRGPRLSEQPAPAKAGDHAQRRAGFTLLEVLVALTLVLAFAAVLGPLMFQARRIIGNSDGRVAAQVLLRALLADPLDRTDLADLRREGETEGLSWRITSTPTTVVTRLPPSAPPPSAPQQPLAPNARPDQDTRQWTAYRIAASVSWAPGQSISGETIRLGTTE